MNKLTQKPKAKNFFEASKSDNKKQTILVNKVFQLVHK
jgi:hypothetical protein